MGEVTVWAQALGGGWERVGADRGRGVWPEALRATANDWGSDTASFRLRRDPGAVFPDLLPFTPVDLEQGGERVWSGFVWEPPQQADERAIQVECRGWQYHTDDDLLDRLYVHSRLDDFQDTRTLLTTQLYPGNANGWAQTWEVANDAGLLFNVSQGTDVVTATRLGGMTLDLGPDRNQWAKRLLVKWEHSNNDGGSQLYVRCTDRENEAAAAVAGTFNDVVAATVLTGGGSPAPVVANIATPRRFVHVFIYRNGVSGTYSADIWLRVTQLLVFREVAYESGGASALKSSDVVADLLPLCPLLDQRPDLIQPGTVILPDFGLEENTPRQGMEQANQVEGMQLRVTPERLLEYRPRPTVPLLKTGAWAPGALSGASRGSGEPIANRLVVKGNDSSGSRVVVERFAAQQPGVMFEQAASPVPDNPTFATNAASWSITGAGTFTRDTVGFDTAPASGRWASFANGDVLTETFTGTFKAGRAYLLTLRMVAPSSIDLSLELGHQASGDKSAASVVTPIRDITFQDYQVVWVPHADRTTGVVLRVIAVEGAAGNTVNIDTLTLYFAAPTMVERRGFIRSRAIRVERPLTTLTATNMADAALESALKTPFKGDVSVTPSVARTFVGDAPVHPAQLLRHTGELLHHAHLVDPDTGGLGRDSRIVQVAYDDDAAAAQATLDNTRTDFETQLARYEVTGRR